MEGNRIDLFMVPLFIRAQSAYKDIRICLFHTHTCTQTQAHMHAHTNTCTHTRTHFFFFLSLSLSLSLSSLSLSLSHTHTHTHISKNTCVTGMGRYNEKKTTDQYAEEKTKEEVSPQGVGGSRHSLHALPGTNLC